MRAYYPSEAQLTFLILASYNFSVVQLDAEAQRYYITLPEVIPAGGRNWDVNLHLASFKTSFRDVSLPALIKKKRRILTII